MIGFMSRGSESQRDLSQPPRPEVLLAKIKFLAEQTEMVVFSEHAQERMLERDISDLDVYRVLDKGAIKGGIRAGRKPGEWICKVAWRLRGSRDVGVVVVVIREKRLWINTVEWEDR
jgi:hypothetical protein